MGKAHAVSSSTSADRQSSAAVQEASVQLLRKGFLPNLMVGTDTQLLDPALHASLQLLEKKDVGTRLKALEDLEGTFSRYDVEQLLLIVPYWVRMFCRILANSDYRLRSACLSPHTSLVIILKDKFNPYLKQVAGAWYAAQFDSHASVAKQAVLSLQTCFPSKYGVFVATFFPSILTHARTLVTENAGIKSADTVERPVNLPPQIALKRAAAANSQSTNQSGAESKDEARERRQREICTGLKALRKLFNDRSSDTAPAGDSNSDYRTAFTELLHENFDQLVKDAATQDVGIKVALFELISTLCISDIIVPSVHKKFLTMVTDSLEGIPTNYPGSDVDAVAVAPLIAAAWECLAVILHKQPDLINAVLARTKPAKSSKIAAVEAAGSAGSDSYSRICCSLVKLVNNAGYGYAAKVFPNLLPIIDALPLAEIQSAEFWTQLNDAFRAALSQSNCRIVPAEAVAVLETYFEIGEHIINRLSNASADAGKRAQPLVSGTTVAQSHAVLIGDLLFHASFFAVGQNTQIFATVAGMVRRWASAAGGEKAASRAYGRVFTATFWPILEERLASLYQDMQLEERRRKIQATAVDNEIGAVPVAGGDGNKDRFFADRHAAFIQHLLCSVTSVTNETDPNHSLNSASKRMLIVMATGYISTLLQVNMFKIETAPLSGMSAAVDVKVDRGYGPRSHQNLTKHNFQLLSSIMGIGTGGGGESTTFPFEQTVLAALTRIYRMQSLPTSTTTADDGTPSAQLIIFLLQHLAVPVDHVAPLIVQLVQKCCISSTSSVADGDGSSVREAIMGEVLTHCNMNTYLSILKALQDAGVSISITDTTQSALCEKLAKLIVEACTDKINDVANEDEASDVAASGRTTLVSTTELRSVMNNCLRQFTRDKKGGENIDHVTSQLDLLLSVIDAVINQLDNDACCYLGFTRVRAVVSECLFPLLIAVTAGGLNAPKTSQLLSTCRHFCSKVAVDLYTKAFVFGSRETDDATGSSNLFNECLLDPLGGSELNKQPSSSSSSSSSSPLDSNFVFIVAQRLARLVQGALNYDDSSSNNSLSPQSARNLVIVVEQFFDVIKQRSTLPNAEQLLCDMLFDSSTVNDAAYSTMNNLSKVCSHLYERHRVQPISVSELIVEGEKEEFGEKVLSLHTLQSRLLAAFVRFGLLQSIVAKMTAHETNAGENFRALEASAVRTLLIGLCMENAEILQNGRVLRAAFDDSVSSVGGENARPRLTKPELVQFRQVCALAGECFSKASAAANEQLDLTTKLTSKSKPADLPGASTNANDKLLYSINEIRQYALALQRMRLTPSFAARGKKRLDEDEAIDRILLEFKFTFAAGDGTEDNNNSRFNSIESLEGLTNELLCSLEQISSAIANVTVSAACGNTTNEIQVFCYALNALSSLFDECAHLRALLVDNSEGNTSSVAALAWSIIEQQFGEQFDVFKLWLVELTEFYGPRITTLLLNFAVKYFAPLRSVDKLCLSLTLVATADDANDHAAGNTNLTTILSKDMLGASLCRVLGVIHGCNEPEINKLYKSGPLPVSGASSTERRKNSDLWWSKAVSQLCRCVFKPIRCFFGAVVLPQMIELREVKIVVRSSEKVRAGANANCGEASSMQITTTSAAGDNEDGDDNLLEDDENDAAAGAANAAQSGSRSRQASLSGTSTAEQQQHAMRVELPAIIHSIWDAYNEDISSRAIDDDDDNAATQRQWSLEYYLLSWRALLRVCGNDAVLCGKLGDVVERELTRTTLDRLFTVLLLAHETLAEYRQYFSTLGGVLQLFNRWYAFASTGTCTSTHSTSLEKQLHILAFLLTVEIFRFYPAITRQWFVKTLGGNAASDASVLASTSHSSLSVVAGNTGGGSSAGKQIRRQVLDCARQYVSPILIREEMSLVKAYARGEVVDAESSQQRKKIDTLSSDASVLVTTSVSSVADDEAERVTLAAASRARRMSTASTMTGGMDIDDQDGYRKKFSLVVRENVREIVATFLVEQMRITTTVVIPEDFPLSQPAVQAAGTGRFIRGGPRQKCEALEMFLSTADFMRQTFVIFLSHTGIDDAKVRSWLLGLVSYFRQYNGSILDGILLWKRNIEKHFQGIEECAICLSIVHGQNGSLPRTPCYKCGKRYHPYCLYRWFQEQEKPTCPLCRTTFTRRRHQQVLNER